MKPLPWWISKNRFLNVIIANRLVNSVWIIQIVILHNRLPLNENYNKNIHHDICNWTVYRKAVPSEPRDDCLSVPHISEVSVMFNVLLLCDIVQEQDVVCNLKFSCLLHLPVNADTLHPSTNGDDSCFVVPFCSWVDKLVTISAGSEEAKDEALDVQSQFKEMNPVPCNRYSDFLFMP